MAEVWFLMLKKGMGRYQNLSIPIPEKWILDTEVKCGSFRLLLSHGGARTDDRGVAVRMKFNTDTLVRESTATRK